MKKQMKEIKKNTKGITLVALVVTIIVLLIIAAVSINLILGDNGIITKAKASRLETEIAEIKENINLDILDEQSGEQGDLYLGTLKEILEKYGSINYEEDGKTIKSLTTTKGNHEIPIEEIWNGVAINIDKGVKVEDIFDPTGTVEGKLHVGDFLNYSAGTWTESDMAKIAETGLEPNGTTDIPNTWYQFGGFAVGASRDGNASTYIPGFEYVQDKDKNAAVTGWRVFDVNNGVVTLISAGCPEDFYHPNETGAGYLTEYILTGNINSDANVSDLGIGTTYKARKWDMYVNNEYGATGACALTKSKLDNWYSKYVLENADVGLNITFKKVYKTDENSVNNGMYESLIDNNSFYWLSTARGDDSIDYINPNGKEVIGGSEEKFGVRVLITLSSDIRISSEALEEKTVISRDEEYKCNVWGIIKR